MSTETFHGPQVQTAALARTNAHATPPAVGELSDAIATLTRYADAAHQAYEATKSPEDNQGNPADYFGPEHQVKLRCLDISGELREAARLLALLRNGQELTERLLAARPEGAQA